MLTYIVEMLMPYSSDPAMRETLDQIMQLQQIVVEGTAEERQQAQERIIYYVERLHQIDWNSLNQVPPPAGGLIQLGSTGTQV